MLFDVVLDEMLKLEGFAIFGTEDTCVTWRFETLGNGTGGALLGIAGVGGSSAALGAVWAKESGEAALAVVAASALAVEAPGIGATWTFRELSEKAPHTAIAATAIEDAANKRF